MGRLDDIKKRLKTSGTSEAQNTGTSRLDRVKQSLKNSYSNGETSRLDNIKEQVKNNNKNNLAQHRTEIEDLIKEYTTYMSDAKTSSESLGYGNAMDLKVGFTERANALFKKIEDARVKLNLNRDDLSEEEQELSIYLNKMMWSTSDANQIFSDAGSYYKQWKTEEDYNKAVKDAEEYEKKKNLDIDAFQKETDRLKAKLEELDPSGWASFGGGNDEIKRIKDEISQRELYYNQAKRIQRTEELSSVIDPNSPNYDEEYEIYSVKAQNEGVKKVEDNWFSADEYADPVIFWREKSSVAASLGNPVAGSTYEPDAYWAAKLMTDDEYSIYTYYYGKYGEDKAKEYLDSIQQNLDARKANELYDGVKESGFASSLFYLAASAEGAIKGFENIFSDEDYYASTAAQMAAGMLKEDAEGDFWAELGYDALGAIGNMLPSVLVGVATGGIGGTIAMGASAAGNAKADMINRGYSKAQANVYGALVGASEALLEKFLGGIAGVSNGGIFSKLGTKALTKVDNAFARVAITLGGRLADEAFEEGLQTVLEPWFESVVTGVDFDAPDIDEVLYSALLGAITAGAFDIGGTALGTGSIAENNAIRKQGKELMAQGIDINKLTELGKDINLASADSVAHRLAGKVNENTGAYTVARLFNEMNAQLTSQNQADIIRSLERKNVTPENAKTIATALAQVVAGEQITKKQAKLLDSNPVIGKTIQDVIVNKNSTVNQRIKGFNESVFTKSTETASETATESTGQTEAVATVENATATESVENKAENVSDDGKTKQISTGEEISIKGIASTKGGLSVELDNGSVIKASDISYATEEEAIMFDMLSRMETSPEVANEIFNSFKPTDLKQALNYFANVPLAYSYGKIGYKQGLKNVNLSNEEKYRAFNQGRKDAEAKAKADTKKADTKSETEASENNTGIIYENGLNYEEATKTKIQKVSMAYVDVISRMTNLEVHVFKSIVKEGKRVTFLDGKWQPAPNGFFRRGNQVYIDINAGNNGEGVMLNTLSHEITHYIRRWNAKGFKELADFLFKHYGHNGVSVDALIETQKERIIKRYKYEGKELPSEAELFDTAYEEVVADAMSDMLADPKAYEKLARLKSENRTLWQKIGEAIKNVLDKFKKALGIYKDAPTTEEAYKVRDFAPEVYEKLQDLYLKAFVEADANYEAAENTLAENGIAVDSETDSGTLMSVRDVLDDTEREKVAKTLATRFDVTKEEALEWLKAETSLASLILNPKYSQYLDYTADVNEEAIKSNSDYPQGTVDFSNICKKRRDFTEIMNRILRSFPNHIFEPTDLAKIRTIMEQEGMEVACAICYVEDRRQQDSVVAQDFINSLALYREGSKTRPDGKAFNANQLKALKLIDGSTYTPSIYELITLEGRNELKAKNPAMEEAWVKFNNARGMQSVRLLLNDAEYKRQILKYNKNTVKSKNNNGGLRIYSFSDMEMFHLIDIIQVITDSATVGLSIQGYTKVNEYAKAVKDTGEKLNRSLIPKGDLGYHMEKGKVVLDFDTVEGIDINHPDFFDSTENPNVGNIVIGINTTQIRAAMMSKFIDYIIPFHTGQSKEVLGEKGIAEWVNYKDSQTEKDLATGRTSQHQINIYTEVIQASEKVGKPITNKVEFVNKFLEVCKENNLIPRFAEFLNMDENGNYVYTEGYHKFLVDFKTFDSNTGEYLPQMPVKPIFDSNYLTKLLRDYVKTQKVKDAEFAEKSPKVIERITNEIIKPSDTKYSERDSWNNIETIQGLESYSVDEVIDITKSHIQSVLEEYGEYAEIIAVRPLGSRAKGTAKADSDLDIVVQYEGDIREDDMFNMLNDEDGKLYIEGIEVDINPIRADESGDIEDYLGRVYDYDKYSETKYSDRDSLGNELSPEQQEFFKDSKVRDSKGRLLHLYHGTDSDITVFDESYSQDGTSLFFTDSKYVASTYTNTGKTMSLYANLTNPIIVDAKGKDSYHIPVPKELEYMQLGKTVEARQLAYYAKGMGYDGVIIKNVIDVAGFASLKKGTDVIAFDATQIKDTTNKKPTSDPDIRYSERDFSQNFMDNTLDSFGIQKLGDYIHVQKQVFNTLLAEGFFTNSETRSRTDSNEESGMVIETNKSSINETFNEANYTRLGRFKRYAKLATVRMLPEIIKQGKLIGDNVPDHHKNSANKTFAYIAYDTEIDGIPITIKLDIKKSPVKNKLWVHSIITEKNSTGLDVSSKNGTGTSYRTDAIGEIISQNDDSVKREFSDADTMYSIREEAPPKNTKEGYKVFVVKNGKLYPPMVANPNAEDTPVGVWLNADVGTRAADSKTGRMQVKAGGKGTQGGSGSLAFRPGWHLGETPLATQFDRLNPETGVKELFPENFVWALCDIAADHDYQEEAMSYGYTKNGKFQHSLAGLPKLPTDGYYKYRTNPNPDTVPWLITGAMKVKKLLSDAEVNAILESKGIPPKQRVGGDKTLADLGLSEYEDKLYQDRDTELVSNRTLLANALEGTVANDIEKNNLKKYKEKIALIESEQAKLEKVKADANELRFTKGRTPDETKKMRELDAEATMIANRISTYDRQLLNLESTTALKNVLEREKKMAYKKAEQRGKEALQRQRERAAKTIQEVLTRNQESRKKAMEGRSKTEMRHKIKKVVSDLNKLLLHGTKERNIKPGLQQAVAMALEAINMDTVSADARIAKLKEDLLKAKTPEKIAEIQHKIDHIKNMGDRMSDKLEALGRAYREIKNSTGNEYSSQFKEEATLIEGRIESVIGKVGNTPLRDMSLSQLEAVYDLYTMVLTTVRNVNGVWRQGKLEDLQQNASQVMEEVDKLPKIKSEGSKLKQIVRSFKWNNMTPYYAFDNIGSKTLMKFFKDFIEAQNTYARDIAEVKEFAHSTREKYNYSKWNLDKVYDFKLKDGRTFSTTLKHLLSIYAYSKREQALDHMSVGGFFHNDKATFRKKGGIIEMVRTDDVGYKVDFETLEEIKEALGKEKMSYVDEMQEYLTKMGEKGNEVTRVMWGIDIFKEKVYFPLKSKNDFIKSSTETAQAVSLKNDGMTKETVPGASNPIVLEAFDDVWANHVERMSQYHAFVLPIDNLNKIHQYGTWAGTDSMAVSTLLAGRFGNAVNEYISQFIKDMNGNVVSQGVTNPFASFFSKFKKTAVGMSLSTVVQQPTAIVRAMSLVDGRYFVGKPNLTGLSKKWEELKTYAPIAIIKEIGGFDAGSGVQVTNWINSDAKTGIDKVMNVIDDVSMKGAELADKLGWTTIWEAVKRETKATTNLAVGSQAFLEKAGERFTEVIVQTQVYDSTLSRSGFMRSKNDGVKMLTSFMGEPTLSVNMLYNSVVNAMRGGSKLKAAKTIGCVYASAVLASAFASAIYALNDDDEDESYMEKYMQAFGGEFISDIVLMPVTSLPAVKDIISIFQGWDVERTDVAIFKDIKDAFDGLFSETKSPYRKIEDFAGAIGAAFGLPVKNLLKTGRQIYNSVNDIFVDKITGGNLGEAFLEGITNEKKSKTKKLYDAIISGDTARLEVLRKGYDDEDAYINAIRTALRENDPRIQEAAQAIFNGDVAEYGRIIDEISREGNFDKVDIKEAIESEVNKIERENSTEEETPSEEKAESIYEAEHYYLALIKGDTYTANRVKEDIINTAIANGKSREEAEKSFYSGFRTKVRDGYADGTINRTKAMEMLVSYGGMESNDAYWQMKQYDYYAQNGTTDGYSKYYVFYDAVRTGISLKAVINEYTSHGVEAKTLASQITSYFKPLYINMTNSERASIKGYLLNAYAQLGYNRNEKSKDIDNWLK